MDSSIINRLNQLNQQFYQTVAVEFDNTRHQAWSGWQTLVPLLQARFAQPSSLSVLDLGCGNGRWGEFLLENVRQPFSYLGADSNQFLLNQAEQSLSGKVVNLNLTQLDIVAELQEHTFTSRFFTKTEKQPITLIAAFGFLHHIPSLELRQLFLADCYRLLEPGGWLIVAAWQFLNSPRLTQRIITPEAVGLSIDQLEEHDYFLDWQRGESAIRYCHLVDETEMRTLINQPQTLWKEVKTFLADGQTGNLNHYWVIEKTLPN